MQNYIKFLEKFKWIIVFIVPLIVLLLASNLKNLEIDGSYRIWFEEDSKTLTDYDKFREEFSNDDGISVVFRDENGIFNTKALESIQRLTEALWDMPHIDRVDSISNYQFVHSDPKRPDDVLVDDFIVEDLSEASKEYLQSRKAIATTDSMTKGRFISEDGKTTMIFARIEAQGNEDGDISKEMMTALMPIIDAETKKTGYKYWLNGGPPMTEAFVSIAGHDAMVFTPLVFLLSMILLLLLFRRIGGALIPLGVVLFTFLSVLAVQTLLGYKLNNFTANIPIFIVAIGIADAVHIYSIWLMGRKKGLLNTEAVRLSIEKNFKPILLTSMTTTVGFSTLAISKVVPVSTLGIATASGAILALVISIFWMPSVLLLLKKPFKNIETSEETSIEKPMIKGYGAFIVKNDKKIITIGTLIMLILGMGLAFIKVDSNTIRYFDESVEIRKSAEFTMDNLTGSMSYTIIVDSGVADGIKEPKFLEMVEKFSIDYAKQFPTDVRHVSSLLDVIKRYNKILDNKEEVPKERNLIAQYLLLYSMGLPQGMEITDQMDFDQRKLRITAMTNIVDTSKDIAMIDYAKAWWAKTDYTMNLTGQTAMYAYMQKDITNTLIYSLSLTILIVSLMMLLIFKRLKILWILLLPNLLPVVLVIGIMGWLGLTIDMGVAIAGAIIIGVAVDDTIHFLVKYFDARKRGLNMADTFDEVLHYAGRAIIFTTLVLGISFSIFVFSSFTPNQNFGVVTASALMIALIVDLLYLPALLSRMDSTYSYTKLKDNT
ncbi:Integral membrane protein [hydrothermal vent metagenome]|uniref:Integral membrane protein n=1 Tax=hydrothermal vent metagenome TaxID=652676 RepID=A0A1W1CZC8_9ZZZZ